MKSLALCLMVLISTACHAQEKGTWHEGTEMKPEFLNTYMGRFTESGYGESLTIFPDGSMGRLSVRQVGREGDSKVPYPTVCSYTQDGKITSVIKRSEEGRKQWMSYATHLIEFSVTDVQLTDELEKNTTTNPNCQNFVEQQKQMAKKGQLNYTIGAELLDNKSFRLHTSGGGDFVEGGPRTESTLDEVFVFTHGLQRLR